MLIVNTWKGSPKIQVNFCANCRLYIFQEIGKNDGSIYTLINEGVTYLDSRAEFWRQQKPMYTRKREKILRRWKPPPTRPLNPSSRHTKSGKDQFSDHTKFVLKALEDIDNSKWEIKIFCIPIKSSCRFG